MIKSSPRSLTAAFAVFLILSLAFLASGKDAAIPSLGTAQSVATKGQRIFFCGHSFHFHVPAALDELAKAAGITDQVIVGKSMIGGSKSLRHWEVPDDTNDLKKALQAGSVDVLTLTPIYLPDDGVEKFAQLGLEHNPDIRIVVQEFWLPYDEYQPHYYDSPKIPKPAKVDHHAATGAGLRAMHERYFKEMDAYLSGLNQKLGKQVLFVAPVGQAVIAFREKIIAGEAPGLTDQEQLFRDTLGHPTPPLEALITYVFYSVIYQKSPVGLPIPQTLANPKAKVPSGDAEGLNRLLQELAWQAATAHPLSGVKAP